jgi:hypothetical protein
MNWFDMIRLCQMPRLEILHVNLEENPDHEILQEIPNNIVIYYNGGKVRGKREVVEMTPGESTPVHIINDCHIVKT